MKISMRFKYIKACLFLLLLLGKESLCLAQADFTISPPIIEMSLGRGGTKIFSFELANVNKEKSSEFKIFALDLDVDRNGSTDFLEAGKSKYSCSKWIEMESKQIVIGPGQTKKIIGKLSVPGSVSSGGYYSTVVCELATEKSTQVKTGAVITWRIAALMKVTVLGGRLEKKAVLEDFFQRTLFEEKEKKNGLTFVAALRNEGNIHLKTEGKLTILTADRKRKGEVDFDVGTGTVLPEHTRDFAAVYDKFLPEGDYIARAAFRYGGMSSLEKEIPFTIKVGVASGQENEVVISSLKLVPEEIKLKIPQGGFRTAGFTIQNQRMDNLRIQMWLEPQAGIENWFQLESPEVKLEAGKETKVMLKINIPQGTKEGMYTTKINLCPFLTTEQGREEKIEPVNLKVTIEIPKF